MMAVDLRCSLVWEALKSSNQVGIVVCLLPCTMYENWMLSKQAGKCFDQYQV